MYLCTGIYLQILTKKKKVWVFKINSEKNSLRKKNRKAKFPREIISKYVFSWRTHHENQRDCLNNKYYVYN